MGAESEKAAAITPPIESDSVIVLASSASAQRIKLPASWRKSWVTVTSDGVTTGVVLGGSSVAADLSGTTTLTGEEVSSYDGGECRRVFDGQSQPFDLSQVAGGERNTDGTARTPIYMSVISSSTGGYVVIERTSGVAKI